jgi:hypothetical protein
MTIQDSINYILDFDESKIFKGVPNNYYTSKEYRKRLLEGIKKAKYNFGQEFAKDVRYPEFDTVKAFDFCGLHLTDTPEEALCQYVIKALEYRQTQYERFLEHVVTLLKQYERGYAWKNKQKGKGK